MSYLSRNGFYPKLYINGVRIPDARIATQDLITVTRTEGSSAAMTLKLRPSSGAQALNEYQGLPIVLDVQTATGTYRLFNGLIDIDEYDILNESIILKCSDDRENRIRLIPSIVESIGYYSDIVFGTTNDITERLDKRLSTIPYSFDFDASGNWTLTPWEPKASADYTLTDDDVLAQAPEIQRTRRTDVTNSVVIRFTYSFPRLHHREMSYSWNSNVTVCDFLTNGHSLCPRDLIRQAAVSAGWPIKASISFVPVYESGSYRCNANGRTILMGWVGDSTSGVNYISSTSTTVDGTTSTTANRDPNGNPYVLNGTQTNYSISGTHCIGASWVATTRFTQNIIESYILNVYASQSINQYGLIEKSATYTLTDEYNADSWERYTSYTSQPAGSTNLTAPNGSSISDYIIDRDTDRTQLNAAFNTALYKAKTDILSSHRQNFVTIQAFLQPQIDLQHTVAIDAVRIEAKGKVQTVTHKIDLEGGFASTDIKLALYSSQGSAPNDLLSIPSRPIYRPVRESSRSVALQTHYGQDPTTSDATKWTGYIGNKWVTQNKNLFRTQYPEAFIVDTPSVEDSFRDNKTLEAVQTYSVAIPNDPITIYYTGKPLE